MTDTLSRAVERPDIKGMRLRCENARLGSVGYMTVHWSEIAELLVYIAHLETPRGTCATLDKAVEALVFALPGRGTMDALDALERAWEKHKEIQTDTKKGEEDA